MIVQMQVGVGEQHENTRSVVEKAKRYGIRADVRSNTGASYSVVEVHLFDTDKMKAGMLPEFIFNSMPGVANVMRVTPSMVSLAANGEFHTIKLGSVFLGRNHPCQLIAGPCTVDSHTPKLLEHMAGYGVTMVRGGWIKPRSRPGSYTGPGYNGLVLLLKAAQDNGYQAVFTEVMDTSHVQLVERAIAATGYTGTVVLWIGARTHNQELLMQLGRQKRFPVMVKNGLKDETIDEWMTRVGWLLVGEQEWNIDGSIIASQSLKQGNDQILLVVRGLHNPDKHSRFRSLPNIHWIGDVQKRFWPPVGFDPSHIVGTMQEDLVVRLLREACTMERPDFILLETKLDGTTPTCDAEQAVPHTRIPEILEFLRSRQAVRIESLK